MRPFREFYAAMRYYPIAWRFLKIHKMLKWLWGPALFNLLIYAGTGYVAWHYSAEIIDWLAAKSGWEQAETGWRYGLQLVLLFLIRILLLLLYIKVYRYLVLVLMAPVLAFLSEEVQERCQGIGLPFSWSKLWRDAVRGMLLALSNFLRETGFFVLATLVAWLVPVLAPFVPPVLLIVESYYFGFSMLDYRNEYIGLTAKVSRSSIRRHYGLAVGNGVMFHLLLFIPVAGVLFAPVLSLTAAGLAYNEVDNPDNYDHTIEEPIHRESTKRI